MYQIWTKQILHFFRSNDRPLSSNVQNYWSIFLIIKIILKIKMYFHAKSWLPSSKIDRVMDNFSKFQILNKKNKVWMFFAHATPAPSTRILYLYSKSQDIHRIILKIYITKVHIPKNTIFFKKNVFFKLKKKLKIY